jgi:hypothetical protein
MSYTYQSKIWPDDRKAEAFAILIAGKSASETADLMNLRYPGHAWTRNSIIGLVNRSKDVIVKGIMRARTGPSRANGKSKRVKRAIQRAPSARPESKLAAFLRANSKPLPPQSETGVARVSHADLGAGHCRYPVVDDPTVGFRFDKKLYCGLKQIPGLPYCETHSRVCFRVPTPANVVQFVPAREREVA